MYTGVRVQGSGFRFMLLLTTVKRLSSKCHPVPHSSLVKVSRIGLRGYGSGIRVKDLLFRSLG